MHSLAREIVMSMPSLSTPGGIFLLYPAMRAAKVLSARDREYISSMLSQVAMEVPVAGHLAVHVLEPEFDLPDCKSNKVWDIKLYM